MRHSLPKPNPHPYKPVLTQALLHPNRVATSVLVRALPHPHCEDCMRSPCCAGTGSVGTSQLQGTAQGYFYASLLVLMVGTGCGSPNDNSVPLRISAVFHPSMSLRSSHLHHGHLVSFVSTAITSSSSCHLCGGRVFRAPPARTPAPADQARGGHAYGWQHMHFMALCCEICMQCMCVVLVATRACQ